MTVIQTQGSGNRVTVVTQERPKLSQQEQHNRQVVLNRIQQGWIEGVLERSLHHQVLIALGLEEHPDAVDAPRNPELVSDAQSPTPLSQGTEIITVFDNLGPGRTLLILGEPGSGKTIALLQLARELVKRAQDPEHRLPVVLNLSSWQGEKQTIAEWIVEELDNRSKYGVSKSIAQRWLKKQQLLLLLDGLDEVRAEKRSACIDALNAFQGEHHMEMVVCCRIGDYKDLSNCLDLQSAICLKPLTPSQIQNYLGRLDADLTGLRTLLVGDENFKRLAQSPLILYIMVLAYQGVVTEDLPGINTVELQKRLFDAYIERMFERRVSGQQYCKDKTLRWLKWLAKRMNQDSQTVFLIERMQPTWLGTKCQRLTYRILSFTLDDEQPMKINLAEKLTWSFSWRRLIYGLGFGLIGGPVFGLISELIFKLSGGLFLGLIFGPGLGLSWGLKGGLSVSRSPETVSPNQGVWDSAKNFFVVTCSLGLSVGLIVGLIIGLISGLIGELSDGLFFGLIFGLVSGQVFGLNNGMEYGGHACIQHLILRLILCGNGYIPWNYTRFLDYAAGRIFLQKVGGGYIFIHRMLLEHFASLKLDRG